MPTTAEILKRFFLSGIAVLFQRLHESHPEWVTLQKSMKFFYTPRLVQQLLSKKKSG